MERGCAENECRGVAKYENERAPAEADASSGALPIKVGSLAMLLVIRCAVKRTGLSPPTILGRVGAASIQIQ
jgi:hypothetical protein